MGTDTGSEGEGGGKSNRREVPFLYWVYVFLGFGFPGIVVRPLPPLSKQIHISVRVGLHVSHSWFNFTFVVV